MIMKFKDFTPDIAEKVFIAPSADVIGRVKIGKDSSIWFGAVVRGDVHRIEIGERTSIQDLSMVHVTHYKGDDESTGFPTIIGSDVTSGHSVTLHGCTIEDGKPNRHVQHNTRRCGNRQRVDSGCRISSDSEQKISPSLYDYGFSGKSSKRANR